MKMECSHCGKEADVLYSGRCFRCHWEHDILGDYVDRGFSLEEPDDHIVVLKYHDEEIARFSQLGAIKDAIRSQCNSHLVEIGEEPFHLNPIAGVEESVEDVQTMREDLRKE